MTASVFSESLQSDRYETMRMIYDDNPTVCILEPAEEYQKLFHEKLFYETVQSVRMWERELTNYSGGNWYMEIRYYEYEYHYDKIVREIPECNIFIDYQGHSGSNAMGLTSFNHSKSSQKYTFITIYTEYYDKKSIKICIGCDNMSPQNIEFSIKPLSVDAIRTILDHEFGHALGLGHYIVHEQANEHWESIMLPSFNPENEGMILNYVDLEALVQMYGRDGFGGLDGYKPRYFDVTELVKKITSLLYTNIDDKQ